MASAAGGGEPLSIEDIFSTYMYVGNGTSMSVANGINLDTTNTTSAYTSLSLNYYTTSPYTPYREYNLGKIIEDASGNFYVAVEFKENYYGYEQVTLTKFSPSGTQLWSKRIQETSSPRYADFDDFLINSNGDLVVFWTNKNENDYLKVSIIDASDGSPVAGSNNSSSGTAVYNALRSGSNIYWSGAQAGSSIYVASDTAPGTVSATRSVNLGSYTQKVMLIPQSDGKPILVGLNNDQNSGTTTNGWIFTKLASNLQSSEWTTRHSHGSGSSVQYGSQYMAPGKQYYDATDNMLYIMWYGVNSSSGNTTYYNYISKFDMDDGSHVVTKRIYFNSGSNSNIDANSITKFGNKIIAVGSGYDSGTKQIILECDTSLSSINVRTIAVNDYRERLKIWAGSSNVYYLSSVQATKAEVRFYPEFDITKPVNGITPATGVASVTSASLTNTTTGYNNVSIAYNNPTDSMSSSGTEIPTNNLNLLEAKSVIPEILEPGPGGLVWIKSRTNFAKHWLVDTERGISNALDTSDSSGNISNSGHVNSFDFTGFSLGSSTYVNSQNQKYASWTFQKRAKFFDIVTYTGTGSSTLQVPHDLGTDIGMIIIKRTDSTSSWMVWHRGDGSSDYTGLAINKVDASAQQNPNSYQYFTSSTFRPTYVYDTDNITNGNVNGATYVAYLFAHNDNDGVFGPNGNQDVIKCGAYTGNGGNLEIDLGFEAQWLLIKNVSDTNGTYAQWSIYDSMRQLPRTAWKVRELMANNQAQERDGASSLAPSADGFINLGGPTQNNQSGKKYIYVAIRRGPMKTPTSASQVFDLITRNPLGSTSGYLVASSTDYVDFVSTKVRNAQGISNWGQWARLHSTTRLQSDAQYEETEYGGTYNMFFDYHNGYWDNFYYPQGTVTSPVIHHMWKRAPGFFDVVAYSGDSTSTRDLTHNLGVAPEMIWIKNRNSSSTQWPVWHASNPNYSTYLNQSLGSFQTAGGLPYYVGQNVSATTFRVSTDGSAGQSNQSGYEFIAYLFASLDGISKVGSYTGTGSTQTINCGFTTGARFVLIKSATGSYPWIVYDSARGLTTSDDPYLLLNSTAAENTMPGTIFDVDPHNSGFTVRGPNANLNASGTQYLFYAIA